METRLYGNLPYKCSIQKKRQIHLVVGDRMNSICPMNFFRTTDTTDTTDTTIWEPGLSRTTSRFCRIERLYGRFPYSCICRMNFFRTTDTTDTTIWKPGLKLSKALIRVKHTNNALGMFLPGSCYTSHIKTPLSVLSGL